MNFSAAENPGAKIRGASLLGKEHCFIGDTREFAIPSQKVIRQFVSESVTEVAVDTGFCKY